VVDHIEYVVDRAGIDHVSIGSDYDGWIPTIPSDQRDCRDIDRVEGALRERGWEDDEVEAVMGRNALEVLAGERG
jgi:membrane dipeptidase